MGTYFPDLPTYLRGTVGGVDSNPVRLVAEEVYSKWPKLAFIWGKSNGQWGEHPVGLALDFSGLEYGHGARQPGPMRKWLCDAIATYLWANRRRLGVWYVIWNRQIISSNRRSYAYNEWAPYRGDNPHTDHVHVSFYSANVYEPPPTVPITPPEPERDWFDMADEADLQRVVATEVAAQLSPIATMLQEMAAEVHNTPERTWNVRLANPQGTGTARARSHLVHARLNSFLSNKQFDPIMNALEDLAPNREIQAKVFEDHTWSAAEKDRIADLEEEVVEAELVDEE